MIKHLNSVNREQPQEATGTIDPAFDETAYVRGKVPIINSLMVLKTRHAETRALFSILLIPLCRILAVRYK
jgi:hypothetical protein